MILRRETELPSEKKTPQIPHGVAWIRISFSAVRDPETNSMRLVWPSGFAVFRHNCNNINMILVKFKCYFLFLEEGPEVF